MEDRKYYFVTPDLAHPVGGIKVIYQFVNLMNKNGFDAYILHTHRKFKCRYAKTLPHVKFAYLQDGKLFDSNDVIFIPEPDVKMMQQMISIDAKKVVFNQNWAYTFGQFREINNEKFIKYQDFGIHDVLTVTNKIKEFLDFAMNDTKDLKIGVVHPYLSDVFTPKKLEEKTHQIAFMPRKNFNNFQDIFSTLFIKDKTIKWIQIDNMTEDKVAEILRDSTMFLALGYPEGLSLPPLEAMKSGCIVLGYSGYGGLEYMRDVKDEHFDNWNMDLYPDGDILNLSKAIFETWNILKDKGLIDSYQEIANNAVETANKWNEAATEKMLLEYLKGL